MGTKKGQRRKTARRAYEKRNREPMVTGYPEVDNPKSKITGASYPHRIIASLFGTRGQKKGNFRVNHDDGRFYIIRGGKRYYIDRPFGKARLSWMSADDD